MIIKRLYKLSQFVDIVTSHDSEDWTHEEINKEAEKLGVYSGSLISTYISKFNDFLKQEIKEEMFYNKIEKPTWESVKKMPLTSEGIDGKYWRLMKEWEAAQKKVIFEGFHKQYEDGDYYYDFKDGYLWEHETGWLIGVNGDEIDIKTLEDLANATNGQLFINISI